MAHGSWVAGGPAGALGTPPGVGGDGRRPWTIKLAGGGWVGGWGRRGLPAILEPWAKLTENAVK